MSDLRDVLIRGSEKIIDYCRLFLAARRVKASAHYYAKIEREQRLLDEHQGRSERLAV
ncbi:hypothetical protein AB4Z51_34660 [Bradyrhizobium sp. 2TAF36]|uniref:hypothetical protein n=1 Tax=Bradyrhizobium sp. 2TAF36 TaxID=3233016 RepID=UPI003F8E90A3